MLLIDTSVSVSAFRDRSSQIRQQLEILIADREILLTGYTENFPIINMRLKNPKHF